MSRLYTVTLNPSLDYLVTVEQFRLGMTNRTTSEKLVPGGKGINVSIVLRNLGFDSTAFGFKAGFVGEEIERRLDQMGIRTAFIPVERGVNRINIKLTSVDGTEINGAGPVIGEQEIVQLFQKLDLLGEGDVLFLSGSVPSSLSTDFYMDIMGYLENRGVWFVVDASGQLLYNVLAYRPFLIKPNRQELGELFGLKTAEVEWKQQDVIPYGKKLQEMGARNVLISLGGDGAVLLTEEGQALTQNAPKGCVVNSVGAGDSMVAGFMAGWLEKEDYTYAFRKGIAAGSASAFSEEFCTREQVEALERCWDKK
ncbi:MAG: 1-phosphofructokinase [Lachnospiraceae bacterium]|nr:1-phosphofructokinase [Lachnospiraceae bacterium]